VSDAPDERVPDPVPEEVRWLLMAAPGRSRPGSFFGARVIGHPLSPSTTVLIGGVRSGYVLLARDKMLGTHDETVHATIEAAKAQARVLYGLAEGDWEKLP
jgi:hypothetical protein